MAEKKIKVRLVHSTIGRDSGQEKIIKGLGLRKLNTERVLLDTPSIRGMVAKVPHLVEIVEENIVPKSKASKSAKSPKSKTEVKKDET